MHQIPVSFVPLITYPLLHVSHHHLPVISTRHLYLSFTAPVSTIPYRVRHILLFLSLCLTFTLTLFITPTPTPTLTLIIYQVRPILLEYDEHMRTIGLDEA